MTTRAGLLSQGRNTVLPDSATRLKSPRQQGQSQVWLIHCACSYCTPSAPKSPPPTISRLLFLSVMLSCSKTGCLLNYTHAPQAGIRDLSPALAPIFSFQVISVPLHQGKYLPDNTTCFRSMVPLLHLFLPPVVLTCSLPSVVTLPLGALPKDYHQTPRAFLDLPQAQMISFHSKYHLFHKHLLNASYVPDSIYLTLNISIDHNMSFMGTLSFKEKI